MNNDNPIQTSQTPESPVDTHTLCNMAKVFLAIGSACAVIGIGLIAGGVYTAFSRIAGAGVELTAREAANGIAAASLLWKVGVPAALFGLLAILFGGILWIPLQRARRGNRGNSEAP